MFAKDQESIRRIQEVKGLSDDEAAKFLHRERYVESVRREAEKSFKGTLPEEFGSAFIEEFCLKAPEIAVSYLKHMWDEQQPCESRLVVDVRSVVRQDCAGPWFSLVFSRVADPAPKILNVSISEGVALATFARYFEARYTIAESYTGLVSGNSKELESFSNSIIDSVLNVSGYVTHSIESREEVVSPLEDIFECRAVRAGLLNLGPPTREELVAILRANNLAGEAEKKRQATTEEDYSQVCGQTLEELFAKIQAEDVLRQQTKITGIRDALGSGRPIKDGRDPEKVYLRLSHSGKVSEPEGMRELALTYLSEVTAPQVASKYWIAVVISDLKYQISALDRQHEQAREAGSQQREATDPRKQSYLHSLYHALTFDQEYLVRFFSS